ncbi:hypothetical protein IEJ02_08880 [Streptomyces sp. 5-10]|nr:hypothetical protein [Streptomyces sp. 5-10]
MTPVVTSGDGEPLLSYPIPSDTTLGPPAEWARPRRRGLAVGGLRDLPVRW